MGPMRQRYSRPSVETPEGQQRSESWRIEQPLCAHDSERASAIRFSRLGMRWTVNQIVPEAQVPIHQLDFSHLGEIKLVYRDLSLRYNLIHSPPHAEPAETNCRSSFTVVSAQWLLDPPRFGPLLSFWRFD